MDRQGGITAVRFAGLSALPKREPISLIERVLSPFAWAGAETVDLRDLVGLTHNIYMYIYRRISWSILHL